MNHKLALSFFIVSMMSCSDSTDSDFQQAHPEQAKFDQALASCQNQTGNTDRNFYLRDYNLTLNHGSPMAMGVWIGAANIQGRVEQPFEMVLTAAAPITFDADSSYCQQAQCEVSKNGQKLTIKDTAIIIRESSELPDNTGETMAPYHVPVNLLTTDDGIEALSADINVRMTITSEQQDANTCDNLEVFRYNRSALDVTLKRGVSTANSEIIVGQTGEVVLPLREFYTSSQYFEWSQQTAFQNDEQSELDLSGVNLQDSHNYDYLSDDIEGAYLEYSLPEFLTIENVINCDHCLSSEDVLDLGTMSSDNGFIPPIRLYFNAIDSGKGHIDINVKHRLTGDKIYRTYRFPVISGGSTTIIQQKINDATDGDTIIIPNGYYLGSLDLTYKTVHLASKSEDSHVSIIGKSYHPETLPRSDRLLRLDKQSSISGISLHNLDISVGSKGGTLKNNVFPYSSYALGSTVIDSFGDLNFENNIVMDTYRVDDPKALEVHGYFSRVDEFEYNNVNLHVHGNKNNTSQVSINNNVFVVAEGRAELAPELCFCWSGPALIEVKSTREIELKVQNNTFVGVNTVFSLYPPVDDDDSPPASPLYFTVNNNIFKDVESLFVESMDTAQDNQQQNIIADLRNNLFSKDSYRMNIFTMENTLTEDPLLTDDFHLSPASPAIDAGFDNGLLQDNANNSRPLDGNNDGTYIHDIGAFEFPEQ